MTTETALAQNVSFSTVDPGQTKAITEWGIEVVQGNSTENARLSKAYMGESEIDVLWSFFWPGDPLDGSGNLTLGHTNVANGFIYGGAAALLPNAAFGFGPNINDTDPYFNRPSFNATRWYNLIKKTTEYYQSRGKTVKHVMPFNEADFWAGQGNPANLATVATLLANDAAFNSIGKMGPSTLSSGNAYNDYSNFGSGGAAGPLTHGSTHHLQWYDSATKIADFYTYVLSQGDIGYNPEFHSLGEAIFSAQYGVTGGAWWGAALRTRGLFVQACQGKRLGYAENRGAQNADYLTQSAAAVYRAPNDELYGFAGGFERAGDFGSRNNYRLICTDRDVYFNGIGPMREYVLSVRQFEDAYVDIDYGTNIVPALDGHRWKIVNRLTGQVLEVAGGSSADGADIQRAADVDALRQKWDIMRTRDGYYTLFNANSGKPADNYNWSTWDGGNVAQWNNTGGFNQRWFIDSAGSGYYYIRNGHGTLYMDGNLGGVSVRQYDLNGGLQQQWQFVLADPVGSGVPVAKYDLDGNANDSVGLNHGTTFGSPAYVMGRLGQAIDLDGVDDYVRLPSGIANANDITVAAWVNWDGGNAQQRVFDFGNNTSSYFFLTPADFDGRMHCAITTGSYQYEDGLVTDAPPVGQWVHVAVTLRGNTGILYVNGSPKVAGHMSLNPSSLNPTNNYVGKSQWPDPLFNGRIDDFRIYDLALSAAEIAALATVVPPAAPIGLSAVSSNAQIFLSWNSVSNATSYTLKYSTTNGGPYAVLQNPTATNAVHAGLTNGTRFYYVVSALGVGGESTNSVQASAVPSPIVAPEEFYIAGHSMQSGTNLSLTVSNSVSGHLYYLLATDTLLPPAWSSVSAKAGTGSNLWFDVPIDPASTNRFFKLDVQRQ